MEVLSWLEAHWDDVLAIIGGVVTVASTIVKLTPTQKDDAVWAKVVAFLDFFSIVNPNGTKVVKDERN